MASSSTEVSKSVYAESHMTQYSFAEFPDDLKDEMVIALDGLCFEAIQQSVTLRPMRILNCNAADSNSGKAFSKAYCEVEMESNKVFLLGDIFRSGLDILFDVLEKKKTPGSRQEQFVLSKLLSYINLGKSC